MGGYVRLDTVTEPVSPRPLLPSLPPSQAIVLCFRLHFTKDNITNNTAAATVRQVVTVVFERMVAEDERFKGQSRVLMGNGVPGLYCFLLAIDSELSHC